MAANLSLIAPSTSVNNTFSATLVSDQVLTGVSLDDFRLRQDNGDSTTTTFNPAIHADVSATLTAVAGTNNWQMDVVLTGTYDHDFVVRLRPNRITDADGDLNVLLDSNTFHVNSSLTVPDAPTNLSITPSETTAAATWDAPSDNGGTAITDYEYAIEEDSSLSASPTWHSTGSTSTTFTIPSLVADTEYAAAVRAVNSIGASDASDSVTFTTTAAATVITGYQIQVYDKNYKTQSGTDGTLSRTLTHAVSIRIQRDLNKPKTLTFQVPRKGDDADAIEIGKVVRVIDGSDVVASFVIVGPLDKTRPLITVNALGKEEILNWSITPWDFKLESSTAADQITELLKNYRWVRQNTEDNFNAGTFDDTDVTSVAESTTETNYYVTLTQTGEDYETSGTYISQPILLTDDFLGDPADITRLRYVALLGNDTDITVEFRHSNNDTDDTPGDSDFSAWSTEYNTSSDSETQQQLGITGYSISDDFRWVQVRFTLTTSDVSITPALQAFEVVAEYPSEISAGSISLAGDALDETFSHQSHLSVIQRIVAARNAEFRVTDDYALEIAERFGVTTPTVTYTVHDNCEVVRFQQQDRRLSTQIWALGSTGSGLTQPFETSASESATEAYGSRPWIYTPNATTQTARTQEIADELALRDTPTNAVVIEETDTTESIEVGDLVSFEYTERSIDTTLRVIAITVADPRLGTPRQIELISDEGFFASQADAIAGVTEGVTGGVTSADAEDLDILEWGYFQTENVFTDDTGAFSGVVVQDLEDNLDNPSGADVVLAIVSRSTSLSGASITVNGDLSISVSGVSANTTGNVTISATATVGGTERVVQQQIFFRIVFNTVDLDEYVTDGEITEFVTGSVTDGLATDDDVVAATDGLVTAGVTEGLATDDDVVAATDGLVTAGVTDGLATDADIADFITAGATDGLVEDSEITEFVTGSVTDGLATDDDVVAATDGLVEDADIADFVTGSVTDGLATDDDVVAATDGLVTAGVTDGLATDADIADFITAGATDGLVEDSEITEFVTGSVTDGLVEDADIADFVTGSVTDGLATDDDVVAATDGLATETYVNNATDGLATETYVNNATNGLVEDAEITDFVTSGDITAFLTGADITEFVTDAEITAFLTGGDITEFLTGADITEFVTDAEITEFLTGGDITEFLTGAEITEFVTDAEITEFLTGAEITEFVTGSVTDGVATETYVNNATDGLATETYVNNATNGLVEDAEITEFVTGSVTDGVATETYVNNATDGLATETYVNNATNGLVEDAEITEFVTGSVTDGVATETYVNNATDGLATETYVNNATNGLVEDAEITEFVTGSVTDGVATETYVNNATDGLATETYVNNATNGLVEDAEITEFVTGSVTDGVATETYVNNATNGLVEDAEITEFVTGSVTDGVATETYVNNATNGLATDSELTAATSGLVTAGVTDGLVTDAELTAATNGLPTDADLTAATQGLATDADIANFVTAGVTDGLVTDAELTAATSGLVTDSELAAATSGLATDSELTAATSGLPTDAELTAATSGLPTDADITAATSGLATDSELTAATSGLPTDADLTAATSGLPTDADLTAATSGLPTDADLTAATQGLATDSELAAATNGLASDSDLTSATSGLPTDFDLTSATDGLATETYVNNAISDFVTAGVTDGLVTAGVTDGLLTDAELASATSGLATDSEITSATSGLVTAGVTDGLITSGYVDNAISDFVVSADLANYLDSDGLFVEIAPFIGSVNAVLGTGIPYFNFYVDYDNELININQNLLAVQFQTILDRLQGVENNVSSLTGRVLTLEGTS